MSLEAPVSMTTLFTSHLLIQGEIITVFIMMEDYLASTFLFDFAHEKDIVSFSYENSIVQNKVCKQYI